MRSTGCDICGRQNIPLNESIKIDGKAYCKDCFEKAFPDQEVPAHRVIENEMDPTICSSCGTDAGDTELNKIGTYPFCDACGINIKNRTFPTWVKAFFTGILLIVAASFAWNWKYYSAYRAIKSSNDYFIKEDYSNAYLQMDAASKKVPEVEDLATTASYFKGIGLLKDDKSAEALAEFEKCVGRMPPDFEVDNLVITAKVGATFDRKDYDGFLAATKQRLAIDSTEPNTLTGVASAYACLYASQGKEEAKQMSLQYLRKAKAIDSTDKELLEYYNIVEYRLDSRKIIPRAEFIKQFPNGWTKN